MLQAAKTNPQRRQTARGFSLPAPVGGLNAREPLTAMKPEDALILDNVFPEANNVALRRGYSEHSYVTVLEAGDPSGAIETLMTYHAANGTEKLFAAANNEIYDVSSAGEGPSVYSTSITSNRWQSFNFSTTSQLYILALNGVNVPLKYDGTNWSQNSITGSLASSSNLIGGCPHKERVWFVEKDTLTLWYLASQAVSGAVTKFPLTGVFNLGGSISAIGTLSFDAGAGVDDYFVAVTSNGEAAVYSGTNPASDFLLVGVFRISEPLGRRCLARFGGDLIVLTTGGVLSMQQMMKFDRAQQDLVAITAKIQDKFNADARQYRDNFGWQVQVYPKARYGIFNVPTAVGVTQRQWVQNTITGKWCSFSNMNANCWGMLDEQLYFGGNDGWVYMADAGYQDDGGVINWEIKTAFSYFGSKGRNKFFKMIRPLIVASGRPDILIGLNVDFDNEAPTGSLSASAGSASLWNVALWNTGLWGGAGLLVQNWNTVGKIGYAAAVRLRGQSNGISVQINGFDVLAEPGGLI